jgi:6-phosphogluconolactonase (cycloisomerase 2 family)
MFHSYQLDRKNGKLVHLTDITVETGLFPRYGVFHPTLPIFYANYERKAIIDALQYDVHTGNLERIGHAPLLVEMVEVGAGNTLIHPKTLQEKEQMEKAAGRDKVEAADILIHPNGRLLYASVRGSNIIAVLDVDDHGMVSLRNNIDCGGVNPRGLCMSPDSRFLFAANMGSGNVAAFSIDEDGALQKIGTVAESRSPGSIRILSI